MSTSLLPGINSPAESLRGNLASEWKGKQETDGQEGQISLKERVSTGLVPSDYQERNSLPLPPAFRM